MKLSKLIILTLIYLPCSDGFAENLLDVYEDAIAFDKTYLSAKYAQQAELEKLVQSRANLLPSLSATANKSEIEQDPFGPTTSTTFNSEGYGLELSQTLFDSGVFNGHRKARLSAKLAHLELVNIEQDLIIRVAQAYVAVLQAREDLALAESNSESAESQLNQVRERFSVGLANNTEFQQSLSRSKSAFTARLQAKVSLQKSERELHAITGNKYQKLAGLKGQLETDILYNSPEAGWLDTILDNNIEHQQERIRLDMAKREIKIQRAGHLPTVALSVTHSNASIDGQLTGVELDGGEMQTTALIQLSMPLFQGGRTRSKVREAKKLKKSATEDLERVKLNVINLAQELLDSTQIFKPSIQALEEAVSASQQVLDARREGFKAGLETNLDVLDAQRDLFQVSLDANQLRYSAILLGLELQRINGSLEKSDLRSINEVMLINHSNDSSN